LLKLEFIANEDEPLTDSDIWFTISSSIPTIQPLVLKAVILPSGIVINFEPDELAFGDTASITIQHRKLDGTLVPFPSNQDYRVQLIEGGNYGTILSSNGVDTSDFFGSVTAGIKFIAYNNIDTSNVDIRLKVSTTIDEGNAAAIIVYFI